MGGSIENQRHEREMGRRDREPRVKKKSRELYIDSQVSERGRNKRSEEGRRRRGKEVLKKKFKGGHLE